MSLGPPVAAGVLAAASLWGVLRDPQRRWHMCTVYSNLRLRHFVPLAILLPVTFGLVALLWKVPLLRWGWIDVAIAAGRLLGGSSHPAEASAWSIAPEWRVALAILPLAAFPRLPMWAQREEEVFRRGAEDWPWRRRLWRGIRFGLIHWRNGIPACTVLVMPIGGLWFTVAYLMGCAQGDQDCGVRESTLAHLAWNVALFLWLMVLFSGLLT